MADSSTKRNPPEGAQRLSLQKLHAWEQLEYGMFIHFGMSTFLGQELPDGTAPSKTYAPDRLDVDQWISVARDAGMRYAVLTAKHVAGHALWPTRHSDYHVGTSSNPTDVVEAFVRACEKRGIKAGLYYCSWDSHNLFGSIPPTLAPTGGAFTTQRYREFQMAQVEELLTQYGPLVEMWIDIPDLLGHDGRRQQYQQIASLQPEALVMMNSGKSDGSQLVYDHSWPTDLMAIERWLPNSDRGYNPWHRVTEIRGQPKDYYLPGEVCDPIGYEWFHVDNDPPRKPGELLGMRLICRARGANLLLDVPPDRHGVIPSAHVEALMRLHRDTEKYVDR